MIYKFKDYKKTDIIRGHLNMGDTNPNGERIDVTNLYFERDGKPWVPVMAEYHFVRAKASEWYEELCKIKAGGATIVSTYIFWIYHEEIEGEFDFSGDLDIRKFVKEAERAGLEVFLRIGPWVHGECRNGGFPNWLMKKDFKLRNNNAEYMEKVKTWYQKIYEQVKGLFYKDGGNIVGIQFENELVYNAEHLAELKKMALEIGYRAPIYTVTGWDNVAGAKIPVDEVVPVFGGYAEAPWEQHKNKLIPSYHYFFNKMRNDTAIGTDLLPKKHEDNTWQLPYEKYPFATCELGGGIPTTHHRRPFIKPMDIYALSLVKLGCGNNLPGYYMYHGGSNKIGKLSTFNESKESGYPNDYNIISYDFQAPITQYGETNKQYGLLNMLHLFVQDFGDMFAPMEAVDSQNFVGRYDTTTLRYSMRTDGNSGYVFINHYQRLDVLEDVKNAVIDTGSVTFPAIDICGETAFFIPFNIRLGDNILEYATTQPVCKIDNTYFFCAINNIKPQYKFADGTKFNPEAGLGSLVEHNGIKIITLAIEQAQYIRKLSDKLYIGDNCDIYEANGEITAIQNGSYSYNVWNGNNFEKKFVEKDFVNAEISFEDIDEPFTPPYINQLNIGGERKLTWKKINLTSDSGFIEIPFEYDNAQMYADGRLIADNFYYGKTWRLPAKLLFGKKCYLVMSEMKDDFYREF